jgi:hypothetical protein
MLLVSLMGCATSMPRSGFLSDYSGFKEVEENALIWSYVDPDGGREELHARIWVDRGSWQALGNYDRIIVDPVVVHLKPGSTGAWVSAQRLDEMTRHMHDALISAVEDRYPVVDEPGQGALRVRIAITDLFPGYAYATPDPDKHPVKAWANSTPGGAATESEAVDSVTGERVMALITSVRGSYYDSLDDQRDRWESSKEAIDGISRCFRRLMDEAHQAE